MLLNTLIIFVSLQTLIVSVKQSTNNICHQMESTNKTTFDFAFTSLHRLTNTNIMLSQSYIIMNGYQWQITHISNDSNANQISVANKGERNTETIDSELAISLTYLKHNQYNNLLCYYKANAKQFHCKESNKRAKSNFSVKTFKCSNKAIDIKSMIAYSPQSYTKDSNNQFIVLLVEKSRRNFYITDWTNNTSPTCSKLDPQSKTDQSIKMIPKFLFELENSVTITGILSIVHNSNPSAIVLFYHKRRHNYCFTNENKLSLKCKISSLDTTDDSSVFLSCDKSTDHLTDGKELPDMVIASNSSTQTENDSKSGVSTDTKHIIYLTIILLLVLFLIILFVVLFYIFIIRKRKTSTETKFISNDTAVSYETTQLSDVTTKPVSKSTNTFVSSDKSVQSSSKVSDNRVSSETTKQSNVKSKQTSKPTNTSISRKSSSVGKAKQLKTKSKDVSKSTKL